MITVHKLKSMMVSLMVVFVVAGAAGFFGGMQYGAFRAAAVDSQNARGGGGANRRAGGGRAQGNFATGDVIAKDDKSITVSMRMGGSKIVFFSDTTQVMKSVSGALPDIAVGSQVTVMGTQNSDGSITAQSIQIRPPMSGNKRQSQ